jgi:hypothetical protein
MAACAAIITTSIACADVMETRAYLHAAPNPAEDLDDAWVTSSEASEDTVVKQPAHRYK